MAIVILISEKIDFKPKKVIRDKNGQYKTLDNTDNINVTNWGETYVFGLTASSLFTSINCSTENFHFHPIVPLCIFFQI